MPNIEDFSAGNINIQPTEIGVESTAAAGRRMGVYGSQIAESYTQAGRAVGQVATAAEQYLTLRDINTGARHAADFRVQKDQQWNDFITGRDIPQDAPNRQDLIDQRINNPNIGKQWRDQNLEGSLQDFESGFLTPGGREWANKWANDYRSHMAEHIAADQSSMAGAVIQANKEKMTDSLAVAAFNNPGTLDSIVKQYDDSMQGIVGSHPTLKPEHAAKITTEGAQADKTKLVQAAIQGTILKGGNWQAIASDPAYKDYIKPAENAQFEHAQKAYDKAQQVADKQIQLLNQRLAENAQDTKMKDSWDKNVKFNNNTQRLDVSPQYIHDMRDYMVTAPSRKAFDAAQGQIRWAESKQTGVDAVFDDPQAVSALREQIRKPGVSENAGRIAIQEADADKKLTPRTTSILLGLNTDIHQGAIKDPMYEATMKSAEQILGNDIEGKKRFADFSVHFMQAYIEAEKRGGLPADALTITKRNPDGTYSYDENSMIYKAMKPYTRDPATIMQQTIMERRFGVAEFPMTPPAQTPAQTPRPAAQPPPRPPGLPAEATWDATRAMWIITVNGVPHQVIPTEPQQQMQP